MFVVIVATLILAAPFIVKAYLSLATRSERRATRAWSLVEQHAHVLLEDRRLDQHAGDLVETVVRCVGDGALTRSLLLNLISGRRRRSMLNANSVFPVMNSEQEKQFLHFLVAALFYDSLRTPLMGAVLRRVIYWLAATAADRTAPVSRVQVAPVMTAAGKMCVA